MINPKDYESLPEDALVDVQVISVIEYMGLDPVKIRSMLNSGGKRPQDIASEHGGSQFIKRAMWALRGNAKNPRVSVPVGTLLDFLAGFNQDTAEEPQEAPQEPQGDPDDSEVTETTESPTEATEEPQEDIPGDTLSGLREDWVELLVGAGLVTRSQVLDHPDLTQVKGIGPATQKGILKALQHQESAE